MKRFAFIFFLIQTVTRSVFAQAPQVKIWDARFGGDTTDVLTSFIQTSDGGFVLGGYSLSGTGGDKSQPSKGGYDYWVVKTDSLGLLQWERDYGGNDFEHLNSICETRDGGLLLAGFSGSGISGDKTQANQGIFDYWIIKTDASGNIQWDKDFGGTNDDELFSARQTSDGGFILGGFSNSVAGGDKTQNGWGNFDLWIIKTDSSGNKIWDMDIGGLDIDVVFDIQQTLDGGYVMAGYSTSGIGGNKTQPSWGGLDYWIVKIDSAGTVQWDQAFGGSDDDIAYSVLNTPDNSYVIGGISHSGVSGNKTQPTWFNTPDYWIVKTDSNGVEQWDRDLGGADDEDEFGKLVQMQDGGLLIAGSSYSPVSGNKTENNLGYEQSWILKTDSLGNLNWDKTLLTTGHDENSFIIPVGNCYVIANQSNAGIGGYRTQSSQGAYDYWIVKFCDTSSVNPAAGMTAQQSLCPGTCTGFLNLSTNATNYQWFFAGASPDTSTAVNPTNICYTNPGIYDVQLIASNTIGTDTLLLSNYITVYPFPPPQSITQSGDTLFAVAGGGTYQWYFNTNIISGATDYFYVATSSGDYNVVATDMNGCEVEAAVFNVVAGMLSTVDRGLWTIFPNPVQDKLVVRGSEFGGTAVEISVYNLMGEKVYLPVDRRLLTVDCQLLSPGLYFLQITSGQKTFRTRFVKQ